MNVSRRLLADVSAETYARLTGGSLMVSPGFLELWRARGGRTVVWTVEVGGAVGALLPGIEFGRGPFARFVSAADGCYGGLSVDPALERDRATIARSLLEALVRRHYAKAHIFDFHGTVPCHPGFLAEPCETTLVAITGPDWLPAERKLQSQLRKAAREGVQVVRFDWERHHAGLLELVALTARHRGLKPRYPPDFLRDLARLAQRDERVRWTWCEHGGRPVCSHIYFEQGGVVQAWQSFFDRAFSHLKANPLVRLTACREAAGRGIRWLNLGATPEGAVGLAYFKSRWGGRRVRYSSYVRREGLGLFVGAGRPPAQRSPRSRRPSRRSSPSSSVSG